MYAVTLLAAPGSGALDAALVDSLRNAWGGGEARWLCPDEAAEFDIPALPDNRWEVWADVQKLGVDLVVQAANARRKGLLLADMDSTMIRQECIDELADEAGVGDAVRAITRRAMNGELGFEDSLRERVALMAGMEESIVGKVLAERIELTPGGGVLLATMKANGAYTALVSGGFTAFTAHVAGVLGFDENRANTLLAEDGRLTGHVTEPILGREAKVTAMDEITARLGIGAAEVLAVGDGANDLGMLGRAGIGIALHAKPSVQEACEVRINHGDLTALLYLQGYAREDFVIG